MKVEKKVIPLTPRVEKGIPMPPGLARSAPLPFGVMQVGESFVVPSEEAHNVRPKMNRQALKLGMKFASRRVVENGATLIRVWRIA